MRSPKACYIASVFLIAASVPASANPRLRRGPTAPRLFKARVAPAAKPHLAGIAPERAMQIQTALAKAGYLTGSPSGVWDAQTQAAMEKLQADNGWQTKLVPDARAIIKLGLGPSGKPTAALATSPAEEMDSAPAPDAPIPASN